MMADLYELHDLCPSYRNIMVLSGLKHRLSYLISRQNICLRYTKRLPDL